MGSAPPRTDEPAASTSRSPAPPSVPIPWVHAALACLPYLLVYLFPVWHAGPEEWATGFIQYDQASYIAHGRAMFERGTGLLGPNPFDPSPESAAIYFHLLNWLMGGLVLVTGLDPGLVYALLGVAMALVFARLTLALVRLCCAGRGPVLPAYYFAMWGGGIAVLAAGASALAQGQSPWEDPLRLEPFRGWWFLYWGRNLIFTTEVTYHVLVAAAWWTLLEKRYRTCLALLAVTLATHPYTGVQLLAILGGWLGLNLLRPRWTATTRAPGWFAAGTSLLAAAFLLYYFAFLPRFPEHQAIQGDWARDWSETGVQTLVAYVPIALLALIRCLRDRPWSEPRTAFLLVAAGVSFGLSHHHWWVTPHMPLHFTRGYVWFPLVLLAAPLLSELARARGLARAGVLALAAVLCVDNAGWLWQTWTDNRRPLVVAEGVHELLRKMDEEDLRGTVLADDRNVSYLVTTYTGCRAQLGHIALTPEYPRRNKQLKRLLRQVDKAAAGGAGYSEADLSAWFEGTDYLLWKRTRPAPEGWVARLESETHVLYVRRP